MPIAGLKSSRWDPCRNKAQYLEQCMGQKDFNLEECQPQLADLKRCCERYQGKSIHCGFDPAVDPPDKHDVLLPDPDIPVTFEPAAPHTLGPGAKVKTTESYTPPVAKDNARKAAKEGTSSEEQLEGTEAKGDTYLALETKVKRAEAKEHSAEPGLAHAIVIAADKLLHPVRNTHVQQEQPHAGSAMHVADKTAFSGKWRGESQLQQPHTESSTHVADRSALPSEQTGESQPKTAGQLSPVTLQRVEKHLGERDLAGAKIGDPAAALKKAAGNAAGTGPADKAAELSAERSGRASGPDTAEQGFVNGGKAAQQTQHAQRGSTEVAGGANGGESADHSPPQRAQHGSSGGGGNGAEQERQAGGNESSGDLPPHILDEQMQVPFVRKGTHGYHIIENMIEKKAERLAKEMDRMKK